MMKKLSLAATVLALCACSSPPALKFPSGTGTRVPINAPPRAPSVVVHDGPRAAVVQAAAPTTVAAATTQSPPAPKALGVFAVNANELSVMAVLRRWARAARVDFSWNSAVDYPVTDAMRQIDAPTFKEAVEAMGAALQGVDEPLSMAVDERGLTVTRAQHGATNTGAAGGNQVVSETAAER